MEKSNQANYHGHSSEPSDTFSRRASGSPSGGILEDSVIGGDDSFMHVTAPEDLLFNEIWCGVENSDISYPDQSRLMCVHVFVFKKN